MRLNNNHSFLWNGFTILFFGLNPNTCINPIVDILPVATQFIFNKIQRKGLTSFVAKENYSLKARFLSVNGCYLSVNGKKG